MTILVQLTLPLFHALILVGYLKTKNTAVTWWINPSLDEVISLIADPSSQLRSVVGRFLQSTLWPSILNCDTAAGRRQGVTASVVFITYASTACAVLIATAGILAPIGLGETIVPGSFVNVTFSYVPDGTVFGIETQPRDNYVLSRFCANRYLPCPGVNISDIIGYEYKSYDSKGFYPGVYRGSAWS